VERVPLRPYVERLLENLAGLHRDAAGVAEMKVDAADLEVSPSVAGSLGLIINEFTTNSFKYAFNGDGGLLTATFSSPAPGRGALRLSDNGVGFKQATSSRRKGSGMSIIEALAKQVGGRADWSSGDGVRLDVEFSLD
jgi:two-component sensor histidine kinase